MQIAWFKAGVIGSMLTLGSLLLFSFTAKRLGEDFLRELGITQVTADEKISSTMLLGSFDTYGIKKTKAIPAAVRTAVARQAFTYAKKYVSGAAYIKQYNTMREQKKPVYEPMKTPDQLMQENIANAKKGVLDAEASLKKADASMKPVFEKVLADVKKQAAEAENPNAKQYVNYRKNYEAGEKTNKQNYDRMLGEWEQKYPANHLLFVKQRLQQFIAETEGVDFTATTTLKNGKQLFDNPAYERKSNRWKMAYRAGKDVVETSRTFVQAWIQEIN